MILSRKNLLLAILCGVLAGGSIWGMESFKPMEANAKAKEPKTSFKNSLKQVYDMPIVKEKMGKVNQNYKYLTGTLIYENRSSEIKSEYKLWIEQPNRFRVEYTPDLSNPEDKIVSVNTGDEVETKDKKGKIKKSLPVKPINKTVDTASDNEVVPDFNGTFLPIGGINEIIHPEMLAQSAFRRGELKVLGEETLLDRKATLIQVDYTISKLGDSEKFWIDNKTGLILKTELYDKAELLRSYYFESIDFSKIDSNEFKSIDSEK